MKTAHENSVARAMKEGYIMGQGDSKGGRSSPLRNVKQTGQTQARSVKRVKLTKQKITKNYE